MQRSRSADVSQVYLTFHRVVGEGAEKRRSSFERGNLFIMVRTGMAIQEQIPDPSSDNSRVAVWLLWFGAEWAFVSAIAAVEQGRGDREARSEARQAGRGARGDLELR